ncbi:MAG TPA: small basic family protein [Abditibacteriaceae bacterium]|jgi:small basic protein
MFLLPLLALLAGFVIFYLPLSGYSLAENIAPYTAIALLAGLDTVLGGWRAWLIDEFDEPVFISGFFINALLAAGLVALGERLGLQAGFSDGQISIMMIGAVVVFSSRIFNNLAVLRRLLIDRFRARFHPPDDMISESAPEEPLRESGERSTLPSSGSASPLQTR